MTSNLVEVNGSGFESTPLLSSARLGVTGKCLLQQWIVCAEGVSISCLFHPATDPSMY